jgi:hypothetical protein
MHSLFSPVIPPMIVGLCSPLQKTNLVSDPIPETDDFVFQIHAIDFPVLWHVESVRRPKDLTFQEALRSISIAALSSIQFDLLVHFGQSQP